MPLRMSSERVVDDEAGGLGERVVVADRFDELAVSWRARVRDHDAVRRRFGLTYAAQADVNCQLGRDPPRESAVLGPAPQEANASIIWHHLGVSISPCELSEV